jgi:anti-sigma B factor antagonist
VSAVRIEQTLRDGCVIVALHGGLDVGTASLVQDVLLRRLSERPPAVVCDLAGLDAIDVVCATVFSTAARPAFRWPETGLFLAGARGSVARVLVAAGVAETVPVYRTVDEAIAQRLALSPTSIEGAATLDG